MSVQAGFTDKMDEDDAPNNVLMRITATRRTKGTDGEGTAVGGDRVVFSHIQQALVDGSTGEE